jgi:hypothetical protein
VSLTVHGYGQIVPAQSYMSAKMDLALKIDTTGDDGMAVAGMASLLTL